MKLDTVIEDYGVGVWAVGGVGGGGGWGGDANCRNHRTIIIWSIFMGLSM